MWVGKFSRFEHLLNIQPLNSRALHGRQETQRRGGPRFSSCVRRCGESIGQHEEVGRVVPLIQAKSCEKLYYPRWNFGVRWLRLSLPQPNSGEDGSVVSMLIDT